jgi:hypothetical protein
MSMNASDPEERNRDRLLTSISLGRVGGQRMSWFLLQVMVQQGFTPEYLLSWRRWSLQLPVVSFDLALGGFLLACSTAFTLNMSHLTSQHYKASTKQRN